MTQKIHVYYMLTVMYLMVSMLLGFILSSGLIMFLGWNLMLAALVFFIAQLFRHVYLVKDHRYYIYLLGFIYIIFFPNSIYVITDFIHFQSFEFFDIYPNIYTMQLGDWLGFTHIVIGALFAVKMGISSLDIMIETLKPRKTSHLFIGLTCLFTLSSIGIYIGRFLRFNSWEVFRVFEIIVELFRNIEFFLGFITINLILHFVVYVIFSQTRNKKDISY